MNVETTPALARQNVQTMILQHCNNSSDAMSLLTEMSAVLLAELYTKGNVEQFADALHQSVLSRLNSMSESGELFNALPVIDAAEATIETDKSVLMPVYDFQKLPRG